MKVIVCGGSDFEDYEVVKQVLYAVVEEVFAGKVVSIIQRGAIGADSLGKRWAIENNYPYEQYDADWKRHGKAAGFIRNQEILDENEDVVVVAFPGGKGTFDMVRRAKLKGVEVFMVRENNDLD